MKFYVVKGAKAAQREKLDKGRPYDVQELVEAYYRNSWHATCVNLKTICILGDGIEDEAAVILLAAVEGVRSRGSGRALVAMGGGYRAVRTRPA